MHGIRHVPRREAVTNVVLDPLAERSVERDAFAQRDEQRHMRLSAQIFEIDDETVEHFRNVFDDPIDFARSHADALAIDRRVGASVDDGAAARGDLDPVTVTPDTGIDIEIAVAIALAVGIVQKPDFRHG